jgi:hypothetical protein
MKKASILTNARLFADLLIVICSTRSGAQHGTGTLTGSVRDSNGAAVPHVSISVENSQTSDVVTVATDSSGAYEVPSLRTGVYSVEAVAPGFSPAKVKNVAISTTGRQRVDLNLTPDKTSAMTIEIDDLVMPHRNRQLRVYKR